MTIERSEDPDAVVYWDAVRDRRIVVQRCGSCGRLRFPPSPVCGACGADDVTWTGVSGRGRLMTWTTTHHAFHPQFAGRTPYTIGLVELVEQTDLVMYGSLASTDGVTEGAPVRATFVVGADDDAIVEWVVDASGG